MRLTILACIVSLLSVSGSSAQVPPHVTGFFTDMHYIPEAGDVVGTEVWIVYARGHYFASVQNAEGEPDPPVVVPVEVSGSQVKFTIRTPQVDGQGRPAPDLVMNCIGTVTKTGLMLSILDSTRLLKRGNSYWQ